MNDFVGKDPLPHALQLYTNQMKQKLLCIQEYERNKLFYNPFFSIPLS